MFQKYADMAISYIATLPPILKLIMECEKSRMDVKIDNIDDIVRMFETDVMKELDIISEFFEAYTNPKSRYHNTLSISSIHQDMKNAILQIIGILCDDLDETYVSNVLNTMIRFINIL